MLEEHLKMLEEAKERDHNKIGRELEYFTTVDYVGQDFLYFFLRVQELSSYSRDGLKMLSNQRAAC